jgi:hypothetical protein
VAHRRYVGAAVIDDVDAALGREPAQDLAQRRARNLVLFAQARLVERGARLEPQGQDLFLQIGVDGLFVQGSLSSASLYTYCIQLKY